MPEASSGNGKVALRYGDGSELDLPLSTATEGSAGADISKLLSSTGLVTYDPGFANTAACSSAITYIDGDAGILRYRGYPIEQLAEKSTFLEVSYLLIYGELPTAAELAEFTGRIRRTPCCTRTSSGSSTASRATRTRCPCCRRRCPRCRPSTRTRWTRSTRRRRAVDGPPAGQAADDRGLRVQEVGRPAVPLPGQLPRARSRTSCGMTFGLPAEPYEADPVVVQGAGHAVHPARRPRAELLDLDRAAGRLEQANLFASVSAGINALFGPLHGGANQAVLEMLEAIRADGGDVGASSTRSRTRRTASS